MANSVAHRSSAASPPKTAMEKGPLAKPRVNDSNSDENDNNEDEGLDIENDEEEDLAL